MAQSDAGKKESGDLVFWGINGAVSAGALALIAAILLLENGAGAVGPSVMPAVNASLNAAAAGLLLGGFIAIKRGQPRLHRLLMLLAFACSTLFFIGYLSYHASHGDTTFQGEGAIRGLYFAILVSHILLSAAIVPGAIAALYFALCNRLETHKKITRWLLPAWLYVSATGVLIYFMLHQWFR